MTHEEVAQAYRQYGHLVLRRCQRILRGDGAAEDMLQEVFVRLWRYGDAFAAADSRLLWLYRVADRCCFDQLSRRRTRVEVPLEEGADPADPARGNGQALEDREIVLGFLNRFDDRLKQVAVLHYVDELSQEEIAVATGWSRQTVFKKLVFLRERATRLRATFWGEAKGT
ncbi:MAG TPA: sigma-70 family RNA polymerase sigma factor [Polyangia bacterium]|jgi:RNA polymerase sigma-70 factor (ECF subfamily)|nr:sigma-70 family RNA polymerase sigma factor [Polyangia bacterium]